MLEHLPAPRLPDRPLVLGHRGASAAAPENTLAAFRLAVEEGADGVELDVWRCGSGEVVVVHDRDLSRVAGAPVDVRRAPLAELRRHDVGAWKAERFRGERVPLLREVLEALPGAVVNVELKSAGVGDPRLATAVSRAVADARAAERVVVSSFDWMLVAAFRAAAPRVPAGLLFEPDRRWRLRLAVAARVVGAAAVHPPRALCTPERVRRWTAAGWAVNVWTVDDPAEAARLASAGVTALISNVPGTVRRAVAAAR